MENIDNQNQAPSIPNIETNNISSNEQQVVQPSPKKANLKKIFLVLGIIIFVSSIGVSAYYLGIKNSSKKDLMPDNISKTNPSPSVEVEEVPILSGKIKKLDQDLKLIKQTNDGGDTKASYYSAGVFGKGDLKGYTRIIAVAGYGPELLTYTLATKDFETFILDGQQDNVKYSEDEKINKTKITSVKGFDTYQPRSIKLNDDFSLSSKNIPTESHETVEKDSLGNTLYEYLITIDFSSYKTLSSPDKNLSLYYQPLSRPEYFDQWDQDSKDRQLLKEKFIDTTSEIVVVDPTGLPIVYSLDFSRNTNTSSGFSFTKTDIKNSSISSFYKAYNSAIPGGCTINPSTVVTKFNDNDFDKIGAVFNIDIFKLKDANSDLYKLAYKNKMDYYNNYDPGDQEWNSMNKDVKKPNFQEYIQNNPLLFVKDYWQRWVALGEYDIRLPGGCGKPVIYLYPEKPMEISVKFNVPVQFTTDIPKYNDSWLVLAKPDGILKNLKSNQTSCQQFDFNKKGSEYAKKSCETNNYPYLYWAGDIYSNEYPKINKGWIVDRDNLNIFLQTKLSEIGLNSNEKKDFIEYWLPDMMAKNSPYYRISFLQTNDLNSLFPMTVEPRPNTVFRIFLDYLPLSQKPSKEIPPQSLNKLIRNGFTLVEWGGLKRF